MNSIQTTGGVFTTDIKRIIEKNICSVFTCTTEDIEELIPVQAGMTNIVLSFKLNGGKYVYRHPGLGSDALVERGRETIMQKIVEDEYESCLVAMAWKKLVGEDRIGHNFLMKDFDMLEESDLLYALKFEGQEGVDLIHQIENKLL